jgi:hypothetical protein
VADPHPGEGVACCRLQLGVRIDRGEGPLVGEAVEDLENFDAASYVDGLLAG